MTTPLEPLDMPQPVVKYWINESGLRVDAETGDLVKPDQDPALDIYYGA